MRFVSIVLCVLLLALTLCACGRKDTVTEVASEAMSQVQSDADELVSGEDAIVDDGNGLIGDEGVSDENSQDDTNGDSMENTTEDETLSSDYTDAYM